MQTRGRPVAATPVAAAAGGAAGDDRIAWLLRTNRIFGREDQFATGTNFARALKGTRSDRAVDNAQVTRWERGRQRPGFGVLRAYEELLELPPLRLVVVADMVNRELDGRPGRSQLSRRPAADRRATRTATMALLDQALSDALMTGDDWDDLTISLWELPDLILYPESLWTTLADRLLAEMIIADGVQWLQRSEAMIRLLGHPDGELPVIAACAALVADTRSQVMIEPLMLLEATAHPDAAGHVLRQIANPTNGYALQGAWWAAAEKVGQGHFSIPQQRELAREAIALLSDLSDSSGYRIAAAEVVRSLDPAVHREVAPTVAGIVARDRLSARVVNSGRISDTEPSRVLVARLSAATISNMPRDALAADPMLMRLLDDMFFHPQLSRRFIAVHTIKATPYRRALARALIAELSTRHGLADASTAPAMIDAVGQFGDSDVRFFLEQLDPRGGAARGDRGRRCPGPGPRRRSQHRRLLVRGHSAPRR